MYMVVVDKKKCDGDGTCVNVCPQGVFKLEAASPSRKTCPSASTARPALRIARSRQLPSQNYSAISSTH